MDPGKFSYKNMEQADLQTALECRNGNLKKFGELYEKYVDKIYSFVYYKTFHKEIAEDIVSQTFIQALEKIRTFNEKKGSFKSWLYRIARNLVIDYYRSKKTDIDIDQIWDLHAESDTARSADTNIEIKKLYEYLKILNRREREIIIMRLWDGLSYGEISRILGKSIAGCKMMFARVVAKIRADIAAIITIIFIQLLN